MIHSLKNPHIEQLPRRDTDSEQLRSYNRLKLGIAAQLRGLMETLKKGGSDSGSRNVCAPWRNDGKI